MEKQASVEQVKELLQQNKIEEAIVLLLQAIELSPEKAENFYLLGNAYRKKADFKNAINNYLKALELDPESPAGEAYKSTIHILDFYNKDMFNH
ncbi:MAG: tetratricopeptide repeat protein [Tannerellaceae bacterium]|nr:tetratricopeptide repeat protein [Tannerellaceae bacterium]